MIFGTIEQVEGLEIKRKTELTLVADGVEYILEPKGFTDVDDQATDIMESAFNALYDYYYRVHNMSRENTQTLLNDKLDDMKSRTYI